MRYLLGIPVLLLSCAGGGSHRYTESDNLKTVSADLETIFYVSLPDTMKGKTTFSSAVLSLGKDSVDAATHQRTLEFAAKGLGETEIKVGTDFSLRVKVTSASDRPGTHLNH